MCIRINSTYRAGKTKTEYQLCLIGQLKALKHIAHRHRTVDVSAEKWAACRYRTTRTFINKILKEEQRRVEQGNRGNRFEVYEDDLDEPPFGHSWYGPEGKGVKERKTKRKKTIMEMQRKGDKEASKRTHEPHGSRSGPESAMNDRQYVREVSGMRYNGYNDAELIPMDDEPPVGIQEKSSDCYYRSYNQRKSSLQNKENIPPRRYSPELPYWQPPPSYQTDDIPSGNHGRHQRHHLTPTPVYVTGVPMPRNMPLQQQYSPPPTPVPYHVDQFQRTYNNPPPPSYHTDYTLPVQSRPSVPPKLSSSNQPPPIPHFANQQPEERTQEQTQRPHSIHVPSTTVLPTHQPTQKPLATSIPSTPIPPTSNPSKSGRTIPLPFCPNPSTPHPSPCPRHSAEDIRNAFRHVHISHASSPHASSPARSDHTHASTDSEPYFEPGPEGWYGSAQRRRRERAAGQDGYNMPNKRPRGAHGGEHRVSSGESERSDESGDGMEEHSAPEDRGRGGYNAPEDRSCYGYHNGPEDRGRDGHNTPKGHGRDEYNSPDDYVRGAYDRYDVSSNLDDALSLFSSDQDTDENLDMPFYEYGTGGVRRAEAWENLSGSGMRDV